MAIAHEPATFSGNDVPAGHHDIHEGRNEQLSALKLEDQLIRVLFLSTTESMQTFFAPEKMQSKDIAPWLFGSSSNRTSNEEAFVETYSTESSSASCSNGNWSNQGEPSGKSRKEIVHAPDWQSSLKTMSSFTPVFFDQKFMENCKCPFAPCRSHRPEDQSFGNCINGPQYPSLFDAVKHDHLVPVSHHQRQFSYKNPKDSVCPSTVTHYHSVTLSTKADDSVVSSAVNRAFKDDPQSGHKCPSLFPPMQDISTDKAIQISFKCTENNRIHPCLAQATEDVSPTSDTERQPKKDHLNTNARSQPYPDLLQAVKDDPVASFTGRCSNSYKQDINKLEPHEHIFLSSKKLRKIERLSLHGNFEKSLQLQAEVAQHILLSCKCPDLRALERLPDNLVSDLSATNNIKG